MKKSLILGILGIAASVATSYGQGSISLSNFSSSVATDQTVRYGSGSGGPLGTGVNNTFTAGLYFAPGNILASVLPDPGGIALPNALNPNFVLGTGPGATGQIAGSDVGGTLGQYGPSASFQPGLGAGATITVMIVAYQGSSYASALGPRGHSTAFTMVTSTGTAFPQLTGNLETDGGFSVIAPEPTSFALASLGGAALLFFRRKK